MSEGSDDRTDVSPADVDRDVAEAVRDARERLKRRGYGIAQDTVIYAGTGAWRRLCGDYADVMGRSLSFDGMEVVVADALPEDRLMLVDQSAFTHRRTVATPGPVAEDPGTVGTPELPAVDVVARQALARPEAVEFCPELEVDPDAV